MAYVNFFSLKPRFSSPADKRAHHLMCPQVVYGISFSYARSTSPGKHCGSRSPSKYWHSTLYCCHRIAMYIVDTHLDKTNVEKSNVICYCH